MNGVLIIDKPAGLTSHDVVGRVRRILHQPSVGHLGTLDPLATGVLPLVTGNLTRLAQFYTSSEKTYEGVIRFGFATDTYDSDGEPSGPEQTVQVSLEEMRKLGGGLCGPDRADAASIFGQEDSWSARLQIGSQTQRSAPEAGAGGNQGIRNPGRGWRPGQFSRPGRVGNLHALRRPRYGPANRVRRPS